MVEQAVNKSMMVTERFHAAKDNRTGPKSIMSNALQAVIGTALVAAAAVGLVSGRVNMAYSESRSQMGAASMTAASSSLTQESAQVVKMGRPQPKSRNWAGVFNPNQGPKPY